MSQQFSYVILLSSIQVFFKIVAAMSSFFCLLPSWQRFIYFVTSAECGLSCVYLLEQIGKTKVFLRAGQMAELDARRSEVLGAAARTIQRQIRTYIARKEFVKLRKAAISLQSLWRSNL